MNEFKVRLDSAESDVLYALMQACGLSAVNAALRTALFTQCRLSDIAMPRDCFAVSGKREPAQQQIDLNLEPTGKTVQ